MSCSPGSLTRTDSTTFRTSRSSWPRSSNNALSAVCTTLSGRGPQTSGATAFLSRDGCLQPLSTQTSTAAQRETTAGRLPPLSMQTSSAVHNHHRGRTFACTADHAACRCSLLQALVVTVIDHAPNIFSIAPGATGPGIERTPARLRDQQRPLLRTLRHRTPHPRSDCPPSTRPPSPPFSTPTSSRSTAATGLPLPFQGSSIGRVDRRGQH